MSSLNSTDAVAQLPTAEGAHHTDRVLDAIQQVHRAVDAPQLLASLMRITTELQVTASIYTASIPEDRDEPSSFSLFACHPGYAQHLCRLGSLQDHPWFKAARMKSSPTSDREMQFDELPETQALELAQHYGFSSCLVVPTTSISCPGRVDTLCLGHSRAEAFEGSDGRITRTLARALAGELHDWMSRHLSHSLRQSAHLQACDVELLRMEWQGLTTKQISTRTGWSTTSVDSRFQRVNARMECGNRQASARRAAAYGLMEGISTRR